MATTYKVQFAAYGATTAAGSMATDVTAALQEYLDNGQVQLCISNGEPTPNPQLTTPYPPFTPDPCPMNTKAFAAIVTVGGIDYAYACSEGTTIDFSQPSGLPPS